MKKIKKDSWITRPVDTEDYAIEPLLKMVDEGKAYLRAGNGLNDLIIEITPKSGEYYYRGHFDFTWEEFNQKYGKIYISTYNFYL